MVCYCDFVDAASPFPDLSKLAASPSFGAAVLGPAPQHSLLGPPIIPSTIHWSLLGVAVPYGASMDIVNPRLDLMVADLAWKILVAMTPLPFFAPSWYT